MQKVNPGVKRGPGADALDLSALKCIVHAGGAADVGNARSSSRSFSSLPISRG